MRKHTPQVPQIGPHGIGETRAEIDGLAAGPEHEGRNERNDAAENVVAKPAQGEDKFARTWRRKVGDQHEGRREEEHEEAVAHWPQRHRCANQRKHDQRNADR